MYPAPPRRREEDIIEPTNNCQSRDNNRRDPEVFGDQITHKKHSSIRFLLHNTTGIDFSTRRKAQTLKMEKL